MSTLTSLSCFDALENLKGLHIITPSLGYKVVNARGFANTTNVRFSQLIDGSPIPQPPVYKVFDQLGGHFKELTFWSAHS